MKRLLLGVVLWGSSAYAQELPPGCQNIPSKWVKGDVTPDQVSSFVTIPVDGLGLKWAIWKDGDQSLSINFMGGTYEGVMCMTTANSMTAITATCRIPGLTVIASKDPTGLVEVMACIPPPAAPKAPTKDRVLPLPRGKVRT